MSASLAASDTGVAHEEERAEVDLLLDRLLADTPPATSDDRDFWGRQFDLGLAWVHFPKGCGGLGVTRTWQAYVQDRIGAAGGSMQNRATNIVGIGLAAPTIVAHASPTLREMLLRPFFTTEDLCCQLFSEPGAGSDLAGLSTSATKDGDSWIVNGQKVWTTQAHVAKWGILLARTDPSVPKHKGLTFFVVQMQSPGIEVRPLFELTGEAEFNEVFITDVMVPDDMRIGEVGDGWGVAMTTLLNERVAVGRRDVARGEGPIARAVEVFNRARRTGAERDNLARLWVEAEVQRLTAMRAEEAEQHGIPGPEGSVAKLQWTELNQRITSFTLNLMGPAGSLYPEGFTFQRPDHSSFEVSSPHKAFLRSRANSIEGGTSEIMRNIIAERVLGLPGEPRRDNTLPWRDVPRMTRQLEDRSGR